MHLQNLLRVVGRSNFEMFSLLSELGRTWTRWPAIRAGDGTIWRQYRTKDWWLAVRQSIPDLRDQDGHAEVITGNACSHGLRFGNKTERLAWLIHNHVVLRGCATIQLADAEIADCLWGVGSRSRPKHWRVEIFERLRSLQTIAFGLAGGVEVPSRNTVLLQEALDCRTSPSDDICWAQCPIQGGGSHHHYIVTVSSAFLGSLEDCRRTGPEDASAEYSFHNRKTLSRLGKKNKITRVFMPAAIGRSTDAVALSPWIRRMILGLFQELTRAPRRDGSAPAEPLRVHGAMVADFAGQPTSCPLLDPENCYIVFGGNGYRPGRGYKLTSASGWCGKLGAKVVDPGHVLAQLRQLSEMLSLRVIGVSKSGAWFSLEQLIYLDSRRSRSQLDLIHLRIYASDNCWVQWSERFGWSCQPDRETPLFRVVRQECLQNGWRQKDLAVRLGIDQSVLSRYFSGQRRMPAEIATEALSILSSPNPSLAENLHPGDSESRG